MTNSRPGIPTPTPDRIAPTSAITSPASGAAVLARFTVSITGTASDTGGGSVARVEVSVDGGVTFSAATGTTSWSFSWTPTTPGQATIRSRAVDNSGNVQNPPTEITVKVGGTWTAQGPGPIQNGQVEKITPNNEVVGAIQTVAAHPTDANILYIGGVNGGIWRTRNAKAASPHWTPLIDDLPSLSIGALEFDPTDTTHRTLIAGVGRFFSSFRRYIGPRTGVLRTTDGGDNWTQISNLPLMPQDISGVAARRATLLATAFGAGVMRSVDGGASWVQVSGGNGLPFGGVYDLASDPNNLNRFYVTVLTDGNSSGIFRSDDDGATWTNISSGDPTLHGIINHESHANAKIAVGSNGRLYVIVNNGGWVRYIGFTDNPAAGAPAWTAMDLPQTLESNGDIEGLLPGGRTSVYLSIAADPNDPNTVYVGGESQDGPFPNFIGARDFSGRLFRGDTRVAPTGAVPSPQWEHLTHSNSIQQIPRGGTASGSAPHAGSRDMIIDAGGDLIEVDEGGIYRRSSPLNNTGDWLSINGDIQTTELHDVAYDTNSNTIIGGAQGNGISQQIAAGSTNWRSVSGGNGGDVAVDNITLAANNLSIRYSSSDQNLINLRREIYDADNNRIGDPVFLATVPGTWPQFVTPVELNAINPTRLVIGGVGSVFESFDQGDTFTRIDCPGIVSAIAYGGRSDGVNNLDVLYVGARVDTPTDLYPATVFLRTTAGGALEPTAKLPPGGFELRDVVMDPDDWRSAYVVVDHQVFRTTDAGASWTDITGNLPSFGARDFFTTVFVAGGSRDLLLVGTNAGVYVSFSDSGFTSWNKLGIGLPNAQVWDLDYDVADDVLVAGTLGRGAWTITNLRVLTRPPAEP